MNTFRLTGLVVSIGLLVILSGCVRDNGSVSDDLFAELVQGAIDEAQDGGAGDKQIAILVAAQDAGTMSLDLEREAVHATVQCFIQAGLEAEYLEETGPDGVTLPGYSVWVEGDAESHEASVDLCVDRESFWVDKVYQLQPDVDKKQEIYINSVADELRACIEGAGYQTDPDATGSELADQAVDIAPDGPDCLAEVGIG